MAVIHGEEPFQDNQKSIVKTTDLTLKKMFDMSAKLVGEQDEISGLETMGWEQHSWKHLSLIGDERVINLQHAKGLRLSDSLLCLGKIHQHPESNETWKKRQNGSQLLKASETMTESVESRLNSSGTSSQDSTRCSSAVNKDPLSDLGETPENFTEEFFSCRCSTTFLVERKTMKKSLWHTLKLLD